MTKTVGRFTIDGETISGPAEYMREQGNARLDRILAGKDTVFNLSSHLSPDVETAVLVALQTDFAGWLGAREMLGWALKKVSPKG
jgi:hypothetical protein